MDEQKPIVLDLKGGLWIAPGGHIDVKFDYENLQVVFECRTPISEGPLTGSLVRCGQFAIDLVAFGNFFAAVTNCVKTRGSVAAASTISAKHVHIEKMAVQVDAPHSPIPPPRASQRQKITRRVERDTDGNIARIIEE
jgi:hypothetical protein